MLKYLVLNRVVDVIATPLYMLNIGQNLSLRSYDCVQLILEWATELKWFNGACEGFINVINVTFNFTR